MTERSARSLLLGGRYEVGPAIGSGGFGTVFRARDRHSDTEVAVKLVPPGFDANHLGERLRREAAVLKRLSSRHIARVYDLGADASGVWLVTELIDGVPLSTEALGRALLPHEVLRVARGLLEGLSVAHAAGVVHADIKPSNVLVPRNKDALDGAKLIDFGLARLTSRAELARELGDAAPVSGVILGTARYMAPEVLAGRTASVCADVYAAGLVLFELLAEGELFPLASRNEQLKARVSAEPALEGRVPEPLSTVLAKMLARDPARRYRDAEEALGAVMDLDTAPVSLVDGEAPSRSARTSKVDFFASPPSSKAGDLARLAQAVAVHASSHPLSVRTMRSLAPPRLNALPEDGVVGLRETLRHLDLPMLDALARRERGNATGRVARGVALALRLELDAAALILEPLTMQSPIARAVGATILAPRARRVTRARVDSDREDTWIDAVPAELAALLVAFSAALAAPEDTAREAARCARVLEVLERVDVGQDADHARRVEVARVTVKMAHTSARVRSGELSSGAALDLVAPLESKDRAVRTAFDRVVRPLLVAAIALRVDEGRARDELERAMQAASESGTTLLEARAASLWGRLLVEGPVRIEQALPLLERASTLLAHGDAPTLEHEAEHHRAAALIIQGRWAEAVPRLHAAREAAHAERAIDLEVLSASLELVAHLALGDHDPAKEAAAALGAARIGTVGGRAGAFAWIARCLEALAAGEREAAEDALAEATARSREAGPEGSDAYVLVEVLAILFDAARGVLKDVVAPASELERFAVERGFTSFYWFDVLRRVIDRVDDGALRSPMHDALGRVTLLFGPASRLARDRRTSAPPEEAS